MAHDHRECSLCHGSTLTRKETVVTHVSIWRTLFPLDALPHLRSTRYLLSARRPVSRMSVRKTSFKKMGDWCQITLAKDSCVRLACDHGQVGKLGRSGREDIRRQHHIRRRTCTHTLGILVNSPPRIVDVLAGHKGFLP